MSTRAISSVAIAGGGIVAWSAAAAIRRRLPSIGVTVIDLPVPDNALADRLGCTLPSITQFHQDIGLRDADTIVRAGSCIRLGTQFEGWSNSEPGYVHAYGEYGLAFAGTAFHQHWLRARKSNYPFAFDEFSTGAAMARNGRFQPSNPTLASRIGNHGYGLHIEPTRYREMMRAFALHLRADERASGLSSVVLRDDGFIDAILLEDGSRVAADLFIDASGPEARIRTQVDDRRVDWSKHFSVDRLIIADDTADQPGPSGPDQLTAVTSGWMWQASSPFRVSRGYACSSAIGGQQKANEQIAGGDHISLSPGRLTEPWLRNCIAVGDAAVSIEPLEWTNLHLAHSAIDRLIAMMPDIECNPVEISDYNREANAEADRVRDFLLLHYAVSSRSEPFWRDAASRPLPASLEHTLQQWRERGRLPLYEEETFSRDSWAAVLIGNGVFPRRVDPILSGVPDDESSRAIETLRSGIAAFVEQTPDQGAYLRKLAREDIQ